MKTIKFSRCPVEPHKDCGEQVYRSDAPPHDYTCFKCGDLIYAADRKGVT
mgnify:CR=1 FL=1